MPSATVPDRDPERVEHGQGPETDPGRAPVDSGPKGPSEGTVLSNFQWNA